MVFDLFTITAKSVSAASTGRLSATTIRVQIIVFIFMARYPQNANESCDWTVFVEP
jgi:hypothetical protein